MATAASPEEKFSCSVCLDLFTEPATIPCGHSFCLDCIGSYWDLSDQTGVYSCPQCRETFTPRPVLRKNNVIIELVEELKKTRKLDSKRESPAPPPVSAELGDVPCDFCPSEIKRGAVRSYLTCRGSYCEAHLQPHYETAGLKRHALVQPLRDLEQKLCKQHQRLLELYCRTDQSCICALCIDSDHSDHSIVSSARGRAEKKKELEVRQTEIETLIEERLKELERLNQAVESLKLSAHKERTESEQVLSELIRSIERIRTEVGELIGAKEKAAVSRANQQREQLEQEIQELRKRKAEMEQLSETEDHIHFLQSFQSVCAPPAAQQLFDNIDDSFWTLREAVSRLKDHLEGFWKVELMKATIAVDVTLDPDTAHPNLILSEDGKQVKDGEKEQPLPDNPKRFDKKSYVLGREGFTSGRHYWEVEVGGKIHWALGVTRESSQRKGGFTEKPQQGFWIVDWDEENNQFCALTEPQIPLPRDEDYDYDDRDDEYDNYDDRDDEYDNYDDRDDEYDNYDDRDDEYSNYDDRDDEYSNYRKRYNYDEHDDEYDNYDERDDEYDQYYERDDEYDNYDERDNEYDNYDERDDEYDNYDERDDEYDNYDEHEHKLIAVTDPRTPLPLSLKPRRLGVYLDYEGGQLSFYNVETRSRICTFTDTFTEKLYPIFCPGLYSSGKNAAPLIICPHTYTD